MARLGLGSFWRVTFANDLDPGKADAYRRAWGDSVMRQGDVAALPLDALPGHADLAWASFPCQDLSLAGARGGLAAPRSGAFWGFWKVVEGLAREGRAPQTLVLENVSGLLTSHGGRDFEALARALSDGGYAFGALEIDAAHFVPQSRPRIFIIATRNAPEATLRASEPAAPFHSDGVRASAARLPPDVAKRWIWWRLPAPPLRNTHLADLVEDEPSTQWHSDAQTGELIAMMSPLQRAKVVAEQARDAPAVGALFKRVRIENGEKRQRAEVRFDGLAGCLRTPAGGSSRQTLLFVDGQRVRSRLMTAREGARLMGLPDEYPLPESQSKGLHLVGDGVAAPVVRWLSAHLLEPLAARTAPVRRKAG
ncbi:MAG: DNA (cytosine-5-)-methyltransferase [Alphaproteobacteria bacterium]|nr:MAG: DNA (cytosine-5-)-methyltransferase [Caulobacteraceae bacterium]TPW06767.1 MAG: DNA (cytosine-5-)-methyltransferase [Alphaproteobacteria bacterium]